MKNILVIAYYFPPLGGAGVQRTIKFCKYLPLYGYRSIIVTGPGKANNRWSPIDQTLTKELDSKIEIHRIESLPPKEKKIIEVLRKWTPLKSAFSQWWYINSVKIIERVLIKSQIDLIYASLSPFESASIAEYFKKKFNISWVADLRDPWALDEMQIYKSFFHRKYEKKKMRKMLDSSSGIVMNTPEAQNQIKLSCPELKNKKIVTITNGYDGEDFAGSKFKNNSEKFVIVHTGYFHSELGKFLKKRRFIYQITGGAITGIDILPRSHLFFIKAIEEWIKKTPKISDKIKIKFAGRLSDGDKAIINESKIAHLVETPGYISHSESLSLIKNANLLFLPMHNITDGKRATIVPGKTYEYMATGNPILAAVPDGDAKDFVKKCGTGLVCKPDDINEMISILETAFNSWQEEKEVHTKDEEFIKTFERKNLTQQLSQVFDSITKI